MRSDNVLLLTLLWTLTALCQAHDDYDPSVICQNVNGSVGKDVNLTCSISQKRIDCCVGMYKFQYPKRYNNSEICREEFMCEQRKTFTCSYSPTTAITGQFRFFLQTPCSQKTTQFTVDIIDPLKHGTETKAPVQTVTAEVIVITVCCLIFIIIFIIVTVTCVKMRNRNPPESQKKYDRAASEEQTTMTTNV